MTVPHLVVREGIAFLGISLALVALSLLFDAPLEEIANPELLPKTEGPLAKELPRDLKVSKAVLGRLNMTNHRKYQRFHKRAH